MPNRFTELQVQSTNFQVQKSNSSTIKPRFFKCKAASINVRTASDEAKLSLILRECVRAGLLFVAIQEARMMDKGTCKITVEGVAWNVMWSGGKSKMHGVAVCVRDIKSLEICSYEMISSRLMSVDLDVNGTKLKVISGYAPTNTYATSTKEAFYRDLQKVSRITTKSKRKPILFGDFNGYVSIFDKKCDFDGDLSKFNDYESTESGDLLLEFCSDMKFSSLASFYDHKYCQRASFYSNDGKTIRVYDHLLTGSWVRKHTSDCRIRNSIKVDSDHRALVATFNFPAFKRDRRLTKSRKKYPKKRKTDFSALLRDDKVENEYFEEIQNLMAETEEILTLDSLDEVLQKATSKIPVKQARAPANSWDSDLELQTMLKKRDVISRSENAAEFRHLTRKIRKRAQFLRNEFLRAEGLKINLAWHNREIEKAYTIAKSQKMTENARIGKKCELSDLKEHVEQHLNKTTEKPIPVELTTSVPDCLKMTTPFDDTNLHADAPDKEELFEAIRRLRNNKSSTDSCAECLKVAIQCEEFGIALHDAITEVWTTKNIPEKWRYSRVTCLFKKGDRTLASNYRTLSISAVLLKAILGIVLFRTREWYEVLLHDSQQGFRRARGCPDSVFITKNLQRIAASRNTSIFGCFLDLKAAYDWIVRNWLFLCLSARYGGSEYEEELGGLFDLVRALYSRTYSFMAGEDEETAFETTCGLLQGGVESPPLFNIFLDTIMRLLIDELEQDGVGGIEFEYSIPSSACTREQRFLSGRGRKFSKCYFTNYCDDIFLMAETAEALQKMIEKLEKLFIKFNLTICTTKTETMILNWTGNKEDYPKSILTINQVNIKNIEVFKYLGVKMSHDDYKTGENEIKYRINLANVKFCEYQHVFTNHTIKLGTRLMFYNAFVRSRLCYCCSCWIVTEKQRGKVETCQVKHLRNMVKGGWGRKGGPRSLQDEVGYDFSYVFKKRKLYQVSKADPVLDFVDSQRAKWIGHVVRYDNDRMAKQTMFEVTQASPKGRTSSILDQFLRETRNYDLSDDIVYKACVDKELFSLLEDHGIVFAVRRDGISAF